MKKSNTLALDIANAKIDLVHVKDSFKFLFSTLYEFNNADTYWSGNVFCAGDYFFDFFDVVYAVSEQVNEDLLYSFYDYNLTLGEYNLGSVTLENYCKDILPYKKEDIDTLRGFQNTYFETKRKIDDLILNLKNGNKNN